MASPFARVIAQLAVASAGIVSRAFVSAYSQAVHSESFCLTFSYSVLWDGAGVLSCQHVVVLAHVRTSGGGGGVPVEVWQPKVAVGFLHTRNWRRLSFSCLFRRVLFGRLFAVRCTWCLEGGDVRGTFFA